MAEAAAVVADLKAVLSEDRQHTRSDNRTMTQRRGRNVPTGVPSYVDFEPGLGYADWRCEILSLHEAG